MMGTTVGLFPRTGLGAADPEAVVQQRRVMAQPQEIRHPRSTPRGAASSAAAGTRCGGGARGVLCKQHVRFRLLQRQFCPPHGTAHRSHHLLRALRP